MISTPATRAALATIGAAAKAARSPSQTTAAANDFNVASQAATTLIAQLQAGTAIATDAWLLLRTYLKSENPNEDMVAQGFIAALAAGYMPAQS